MALIDRLSSFIKYPGRPGALPPEEACRLYKENGGILKIEQDRLVFPDQDRLVNQLTEHSLKLDDLTQQLRFWQRQYRGTASDNLLEEAMKVTDLLFWEHLLKFGTEKGYRDAFEKVDLPMNQIHDESYRKIIRTFIKDAEYRKNLVRAKTGPLSRPGDSIREMADKKREFKRKIVSDKLSRITEERDALTAKMRILEALLDWKLRGEVEQERPVIDEEGEDLQHGR